MCWHNPLRPPRQPKALSVPAGPAARWWTYQRERFPVLAHELLIAAFSFSAVSCSALVRGAAGVGIHAALTETEAGRLRTSLTWAQIDEVRPVRRIPVDRRHQAKVDQVRLAKLLR